MPWPMCRHVERQAQHLSAVMERLGVDGAAAARHQHGVAFAQARTNCILCRSAIQCSRWLENVPGADDPAQFCPNMAFFESITRR